MRFEFAKFEDVALLSLMIISRIDSLAACGKYAVPSFVVMLRKLLEISVADRVLVYIPVVERFILKVAVAESAPV